LNAEELLNRHQSLEQRLTSLRLTTVDVRGNGNCFYRAACHVLHGNDDFHAELRQELADYVIKSGSLLGGLVSSSSNKALFGMYAQALKTNGESVSEEAIFALANMCQREVRIYTAYINPLVYRPACGDVIGEPVSLAFYEPDRAVVPITNVSQLN
jgi:hypothetical protein